MHENTPYFFIFPFLKCLGGLFPPCPPPPWHHLWIFVMKPQKSNPMDLYYKLIYYLTGISIETKT